MFLEYVNSGRPLVETTSWKCARMIERASESVVQVRSGGGRDVGAGVIWNKNGLVLTNYQGRRNAFSAWALACCRSRCRLLCAAKIGLRRWV